MTTIRLMSTIALAVALTSFTVNANAPTLPMPVASDAATLIESSSSDTQIFTSRMNPRASRSYARFFVLEKYGWTGSEYRSLVLLWEKESGWRHTADNPTSSAYGIPQLLGMKTKDAKRQIEIGAKYIKHRYGTPTKAWQFWKRNGWY